MRPMERTREPGSDIQEASISQLQHNPELSACIHGTLRRYKEAQRQIVESKIDFDDFYKEKLQFLEEDGQTYLVDFMQGMYVAGSEIGQVIGERMTFGGFYTYETLQNYSLSKGRSLTVIEVSEEPYRTPKLLKTKFGGLLSSRPDLAEVIAFLKYESTRRGAMATMICFRHLFRTN